VRVLNKANIHCKYFKGTKLTDKTVAKVYCTILHFSVNSNNTHYVLEITRIQMKFLQSISPVQISQFVQYKFCLPNLTRLPNAHAHEHYFEQVAGVSACRDGAFAIEVLALVMSSCGVVHKLTCLDLKTMNRSECFTKVY